MATTAQIFANRLNSKQSTGPQTAEGKAVVSQNAVKHGIFAESVIKGEDPADYEAFHEKFLAELAPVGMTESVLAERLISLWWRLKRVERMQNQAIDVMIARDEPSPLTKSLQNWLPKEIQETSYDTRGAGPELVLGRSVIEDWSNSRVLDRMMLYERRIENSVIKMKKELKRFQVIRRLERQDAEKQFAHEQAIPQACGFKAATLKKGNLKKQSQYIQDLMSVKSLMQGDYGNKPASGIEENKANQSQLHARALSKRTGKRKKSLAAANSLTG